MPPITFTDTMGKVWNALIGMGMTKAGAAGMMGNMYAESGIIPNRVEILCLKRLAEVGKNYTDASYTAAVDNGAISKATFMNPLPGRQYGYGLCQWTSPGRKSGLYDLCKSKGVSIGDLTAQIEWLGKELKASYTGVWSVLTSTDSVQSASDKVLISFECPGNVGSSVKSLRGDYSKQCYDKYAKTTGDSGSANAASAAGAKATPAGTEGSMTEEQAIEKVITLAKAEVGYLEKASASNLDSKTANPGSNNYTKYGRDMHALQPSNMDYPAAWCDCFVDWIFYKAFGKDLAKQILCGNFDDYTVNSAGYYKNAGRWTSTPKKGYQVFFKNASGICHTGIVTQVSGNIVYTIEGNSNNAVRAKSYAKTDSYIAGYGMPKYSLAAGKSTPATPAAPSQSAVTEKKATQAAMGFDKTLAGAYKTTADLHIRDGAGTSNPSLGVLPKGTTVQNYGYYTSVSGKKWLYIQTTVNKIKYTGFSSSTYLKRT